MTNVLTEDMLERERIANRRKHWVRAVTACNSRCIFCLDSDTPRNVYIPVDEVKREIDRGRSEFDADKIIISGGEASLHPDFPELIRYAKSVGYDRVQTVTNGYRFSDAGFFHTCIDAGLGEITFSIHGDTPELHDRLTGTPGAFRKLMKGMIRAIRDGRPIVNVDIVINKQNVGVIDRIVELCMSVGVTEFDLLHVIPQAAAFQNRDELFYDPREHLPRLQKVFRLNRHPRFVIWTNRFPIAYLEGLEDLIQDPHKMLDEVNGRRFQVRRYLDEGKPLDCRQKERCIHCFMEPFCTTMDRVVTAQNENAWDVWHAGTAAELRRTASPLPFGCTFAGAELTTGELASIDLPENAGIYAELTDDGALPPVAHPLVAVASTAAQLERWTSGPIGRMVAFEIRLNRDTAPWMLAHRDVLERELHRIVIRQPGHEHLAEAAAADVRDPRTFFEELALRVRVAGLPACLAPGTQLVDGLHVLPKSLFDGATGRLSIRNLSRYHIVEGYRAKSLRCSDCRLNDVCDGIHINMIRDQGLAMARPLTDDAWAADAAQQLSGFRRSNGMRLNEGRPLSKVADSLPGFAPPSAAPLDPLEVIAARQKLERAEHLRSRGITEDHG